jgi:transposase-like protein
MEDRMPFEKKISDDELRQALAQGLSVQAIAAEFDMARSSIQWRVQRLRNGAIVTGAGAPPEVAGEQRVGPQPTINGEPGSHLDTMQQLLEINRRAHGLLKRALTKGNQDPPTAIRLMAEIRQQLEFQLKIYQVLYDLTAHAEFQRAALAEIEAEEPATKARIIARLREWRARRGAARLK